MAHPALARVDHRPWPLPQRPWSWRQSCCDLLFAHWPLPAAALRPLVPASLEIQEFDGSAWLGLLPLRMRGLAHRALPNLPGLSRFPALGLQTYVERDGKPGVFFLRLDAASRMAVWLARRFLRLPCGLARMSVDVAADGIRTRSVRHEEGAPVVFEAVYRAASLPYEARPGTREHWLTERYCVYAASGPGALYRAELHHLPWQLQHAEAILHENDLFLSRGLDVTEEPAVLHFSRRADVVVWSAERISE